MPKIRVAEWPTLSNSGLQVEKDMPKDWNESTKPKREHLLALWRGYESVLVTGYTPAGGAQLERFTTSQNAVLPTRPTNTIASRRNSDTEHRLQASLWRPGTSFTSRAWLPKLLNDKNISLKRERQRRTQSSLGSHRAPSSLHSCATNRGCKMIS